MIVRGIERRAIFRCDADRQLFIGRLGDLITEGAGALYAWCLMTNHAHILFRTGAIALSTTMRRWIGPYASAFNRRHARAGHLFQNRFKSILVEEQPYMLELVRYIHLNPVRAQQISSARLDTYRWTGHSVLLGNRSFDAQDSDAILSLFGPTVGVARRSYRDFVRAGAKLKTSDLEGGGLRRSSAGMVSLPSVARGREDWAHDERVLGSSDFVKRTIVDSGRRAVNPEANPPELVERLLHEVATRFGVSATEIASPSLRRQVLAARAALCHVAVRRHAVSLTGVARALNISKQSVARAVHRADALDEPELLLP